MSHVGAPERTHSSAGIAFVTEGATNGGHEAADRRRSARGHQGGTRHRHARSAGGWRAARRRAVGRRGQCSRRRPEERRGLTSALDHEPRSAARTMPAGASRDLSPSMLPAVTPTARSAVAATDVDVIAVGTTQGDEAAVAGSDVGQLGDRIGVDLAAYLIREKAKGSAGEVVALPVPGDSLRTVLLVGTGDGSAAALRKAGAAVGRRCRDATAVATSVCAEADPVAVRAFVEGLLLSTYSFTVKSGETPPALERVELETAHTEAVALATATAGAVRLARDLANTPSLQKDPAWLADRASRLGKPAGVEVNIRDEKALSAEGFGGILAVGSGSVHPPRLIEMSWRPAGAARTHVVLIGKGITFDSGGLSIKPSDGMVAMKTDMAGGAAVIAVMTALSALGVRAR